MKLYESFSHHKESSDELRSKSLYFSEMSVEPKKDKNIKLSDYFQKCEELINRVEKEDKPKGVISSVWAQFEEFKIEDISSLI